MILSYQTIRRLEIVRPWHPRATVTDLSGHITTFGAGPAGYDVRAEFGEPGQGRRIGPGDFVLASTIERFVMPDNVLGVVHDKSSWARRGLCVQNTVLEPKWEGFLTLELTNHGAQPLLLDYGVPIAQIVFHFLDEPTQQPYSGKYQNQERGPQEARFASATIRRTLHWAIHEMG